MKALDFTEVASLINHSRVTKISLEPLREERGKWAFYKGVNKVPHFEYNFEILYIYADITIDALKSAAASIKLLDATQIVYAPSAVKIIENNKTYINNKFIGLRTTSEYLFDFIQDQMSKYRDRLESLSPEFFIEPPYETPSGFINKFPNPLLLMLKDSSKSNVQGELAILLAEPGQGKTYTTRYLASQLGKYKTIPIYVNSPQWSSMPTDDLTSIWKTITNSFKWFESEIDWIGGNEEQFIRTCMRAGIFALIFDGFDEYVLWNHGKIDPLETLENLYELADFSGSNILVTSRTSFWNSELSANTALSDKLNPSIYSIKPFDRNHATNYFKKRFPSDDTKVSTAVKIFDTLTKTHAGSSANLAGRGFILYLIADLADSEDIDVDISLQEKSSLLNWVIEALCRREVVRQRLPIDTEQQLTILKEIAEYRAFGILVTNSIITEILFVYSEKLSLAQITNLVGDDKNSKRGSLQDHPLLNKDANGLWSFFHDQIYYNLIVEQIFDYIFTDPSRLVPFFRQLKEDGPTLFDVSATLLEFIFSKFDKARNNDNIKKAIAVLLAVNDKANLIATTVAMLAVNKIAPIGRERSERSMFFVELLNHNKLNNLVLAGTIASMDFCDYKFTNCVFEQVTWTNCKFNIKTQFESCTFNGGKAIRCDGFGLAKFIKENIDSSAKYFIDSEKIIAGAKTYDINDLKTDIDAIIKKFVPKEGIGFRSVYERHLDSGLISRSHYRDDVVDILQKYIIERHELSGVTGGAYHIRELAKSAILHYETNGAFTGALKDAYKELKLKLKLR